MGEGAVGLDLQAEDCRAEAGAFRQQPAQDGAGQEHAFRSESLERGERLDSSGDDKCICDLFLRSLTAMENFNAKLY